MNHFIYKHPFRQAAYLSNHKNTIEIHFYQFIINIFYLLVTTLSSFKLYKLNKVYFPYHNHILSFVINELSVPHNVSKMYFRGAQS